MTPRFLACFATVVGTEGGFQCNPSDPGNYTPAGVLVGTKFGISARSYPTVDIRNLTVDGAREIYARDFWPLIRGDEVPAPLALILFDGAVNSGATQSVKWLQDAVTAYPDGDFGPHTMAALDLAIGDIGVDGVCAEILARRIVSDSRLANWTNNALGWSRRIARLPFQAADVK